MKLTKKMKRILVTMALVALVAAPTAVRAFAISNAGPVGYSGRLLDDKGAPVAATLPMVIRVYDSAEDGALLYKQEYADVVVEQGYFNLVLSLGADAEQGGAAAVIDSVLATTIATRYLEVSIDGEVLSPRQAITASPWAILVRP